jgi:hypothetical protein
VSLRKKAHRSYALSYFWFGYEQRQGASNTASNGGEFTMGAKVSAEMKHALFLVVQEGQPVKASAKIAGVDASSVYKALRRIPHRTTDLSRPSPQWRLMPGHRNPAT